MISDTRTSSASACARLAGQGISPCFLSGEFFSIDRASLQASPRQSSSLSPSFINIKTQMKDHHHGKDFRNPGEARANV